MSVFLYEAMASETKINPDDLTFLEHDKRPELEARCSHNTFLIIFQKIAAEGRDPAARSVLQFGLTD